MSHIETNGNGGALKQIQSTAGAIVMAMGIAWVMYNYVNEKTSQAIAHSDQNHNDNMARIASQEQRLKELIDALDRRNEGERIRNNSVEQRLSANDQATEENTWYRRKQIEMMMERAVN